MGRFPLPAFSSSDMGCNAAPLVLEKKEEILINTFGACVQCSVSGRYKQNQIYFRVIPASKGIIYHFFYYLFTYVRRTNLTVIHGTL